MKAERFSIHPDNPELRKIKKVAEVLNNGGVIILPTDTIYALACLAGHPKAVERLSRIKDVNPQNHNFSLICQDISQVSAYVRHLDTPVYKVLKRALPGPFTFIFESSNELHKQLKTRKKTVGIRVPDHQVPLELVSELGIPLITTSIRDDDDIVEYTTDPEEIYENYGEQVDAMIDSGMGNNEPSTVVDVSGEEPELVREGMGDLSRLEPWF